MQASSLNTTHLLTAWMRMLVILRGRLVSRACAQVRPGGLLDAPRPGAAAGGLVMAGPNAFGLPPRRTPGSILRSQACRCTACT
jgi:hypothetical protein